MRTWSVEHVLRTLWEITRPPRQPFADLDTPLAEFEGERDCLEPGELVPPPKSADDICDRLDDVRAGINHLTSVLDAQDRYATDAEFRAAYSKEAARWRGVTDRLAPNDGPVYGANLSDEYVADYMARAERVESGYIIHDVPSEASGHSPEPPSEGQPTFEALQAITEEILRAHVLNWRLTDADESRCGCGQTFDLFGGWSDHVAEIQVSAITDAFTVAQNTAAEQNSAPK